ncbi:aminotransferase class III-fold pyridoxal phosphate-dependent enzyme [Streptomyces avermitilis]|uniref:aminotransferase class III-fold pyridoxal phosphate-dependent enzyme n=1 Tax=Streptomyces avermitilis TaxID=33903 RepID=UPI003405E3AA
MPLDPGQQVLEVGRGELPSDRDVVQEAGRRQHNGTFRGYNPAFVTGARARELFWSDGALEARTTALGERVGRALADTARRYGLPAPRGRGLAWGLPFRGPGAAREVCDAAYRSGLLLETAGPNDKVAKVLPPLTVADEQLELGLGLLDESNERENGCRSTSSASSA